MALRHPHHVPARQLPLSGRARASGAVGARTTHRKPRWQDEVSTVSGWRAAGLELVAPGVLGAFEAAARGALPLRLGGQILSRPARIGEGVAEGDVDHGMVGEPLERRPGTPGVPPIGTAHAEPPGRLRRLAENVLVGRRARQVEHRGVAELLGLGAIAGVVDETRELLVGDARGVDLEGVEVHLVDGRLTVAGVADAARVAHPETPCRDRDGLDRVSCGCGHRSACRRAFRRGLLCLHRRLGRGRREGAATGRTTGSVHVLVHRSSSSIMPCRRGGMPYVNLS